MYRTHAGLALRAVGESPGAAEAAGIRVNRVRFGALVFGGHHRRRSPAATLVLAQAGTFAEGMSAGRGFIAIAIVVLGRWHPLGVALAALVFGAASALQFLLQALGLDASVSAISRAAVRAHARRAGRRRRTSARAGGAGARRRRSLTRQQRRRALVQRARQRPSSPRSMRPYAVASP